MFKLMCSIRTTIAVFKKPIKTTLKLKEKKNYSKTSKKNTIKQKYKLL